MDWRRNFFQNPIVTERLEAAGFIQQGKVYQYQESLDELDLELQLQWDSEQQEMAIRLWDPVAEAAYQLAFLPSVKGAYVGQVRKLLWEKLGQIEGQVSQPQRLFSAQAESLLDLVKVRWGWELDFLWQKLPKAAVFRYGSKQTWFGVMQEVDWQKIDARKQGPVTLLSLKSDQVASLVESGLAYPGYHMNKKYWISFPLDGSYSLEEILKHLVKSYQLIGGDLTLERKMMKILLPTAKELDLKGSFIEGEPLSPAGQLVLKALEEVDNWSTFFKLKADKAKEEEERFQALRAGEAQNKPALQLFNGLMYRQIDRTQVDNPFWNQVWITSSLYGCVPIVAPMAPHRLDFQVPLQVEGQSLTQFWRPHFDAAIG
ncbi:peroxide stress protein YaaA, partial [Streptococcus danieliae]|uniref:peroxide stress protein YaaA n=1 Tax=Streptococcus danieliae TaxID=747656 RepID=UPI0026E91F2F